ncbi:protein kinase [Stieleria sp. TO1_6]|uniref:protein kinase domain-containing protein n=1 Tax=Stieleria tagensis TaxID=2956795 RepID=UPI00209B027A|nr:protein kinase [Stieleria tagensis]MCO8125084.1 protein kinase [Stieleria tagensis]
MNPEPPDDQPQEIDETVHIEPSNDATIQMPTSTEQTRSFDDDKRVGGPTADAIEKTVDAEEFANQSDSVAPFGIGAQPDDNNDANEKTLANIESTIDMSTIQLRPASHQTQADSKKSKNRSVMHSEDLSQTINPRELNKEDAELWDASALNDSKANRGEVSKLSPAIERSISESKLQIRERDLAAPTRPPESPSDYRIVRLLGRGGMGNVYVARQASLDRMIAVKVIRPLSKAKRQQLNESGRLNEVENERRQQFLSEAVVTGDLDHPNIVPIHDIAVAADNTLFYAMKRVVGQPWLKTIADTPRDQNLEILLKVCDAIAFAHTRGVVHRDIKPENIMLGDFGEVLVMDWGLALAKPEFEKKDSITSTVGLGGTPAFMAPEMATGPVDAIGPHSDIYLLGATLFYIVTGYAPHKAANVSQCIRAVTTNTIQSAPESSQGELLDIAMRAMATKPADRYPDVKSFQQAIRAYRSHSESIAIASIAGDNYRQAIKSGKYDSYSRATHGFEQAIALWSENQSAIDALSRCRIDYAQAAYENSDFDLGLSLLNPDNGQHLPLIAKLNEGMKQRELRASRLTLFRRVAAASLMFILLGGSAALLVINSKRNEADEQRQKAVEQTLFAEQQKEIADKQTLVAINEKDQATEAKQIAQNERDEAKRQKKRADEQRELAVKAQRDAELARDQEKEATKEAVAATAQAVEQRKLAEASEKRAQHSQALAEYESYLSQVGLAKARIDGNEFDDARRILATLRDKTPDQSPAWEWRWLWEQANQSQSTIQLGGSVADLATDADQSYVIAIGTEGTIHRADLVQGRFIDSTAVWSRSDDATCVAIRGSDSLLAVGNRLGDVLIMDVATGEIAGKLSGHDSAVTDIAFLDDGRLLTSSTDRSVMLWNPDLGKALDRAWHIAAVVKLAASDDSAAGTTVLAGVSDAKSGRVVGWQLIGDQLQQRGEFSMHDHPVASVAISADGQLAASGDTRGQVYLWRPADLQQIDFEKSIEQAIAGLETDSDDPNRQQLVNATPRPQPNVSGWRAHRDAVSSIVFDPISGTLLTASDDYTIRVWNTSDRSLKQTLRGHGGWVKSIELGSVQTADNPPLVISASIDGTLRTWDRSRMPANANASDVDAPAEASQPYRLTARTDAELDDETENQSTPRETRAHTDEILSARFNRNGKQVISASRDHTARILGVDRNSMSFREIARIKTNDQQSGQLNEGTEFLAMSAQIDAQGKRLFVGSADSNIRIWDIETGTQLGMLTGTGLNSTFALSTDGRRLLSGSSGKDAKAILWDVDRLAAPRVLYRLAEHDQAVTSFALSSDGSVLATGDRNGRCLIWDGNTGKPIGKPIDLFQGFRINELAFSPDAQSLWVASDSGQLSEFNLTTRKVGRQLPHEGFVIGFSLSPQGDQAVTVSQLTDAKSSLSQATLWDLNSQKSRELASVTAPLTEGRQTQQNAARINSARFGSRGTEIVVCQQNKSGRTGQVAIFNLTTQLTRTFKLPQEIGAPETGMLSGLNQLFTLNGAAAFRWDIQRRIHDKSYRAHAAVTAASFSPDSKIAATASRSVRFWDAKTGEGIDKLENPHGGAISGLDFSDQMDDRGYRFVTCGNDAAAKLWTWKDRKSGFQLEREMSIPAAKVTHVRFNPAGDAVMLSGDDGTLQIQSLSAGTNHRTLQLPPKLTVTCAAFSRGGKYLAVGASDKSAFLFDLEASPNTPLCRFQGHADQIESICVLVDSTDNLRVLTASRDKSARVWDPRLELRQAESGEDVESQDSGDAPPADRSEPVVSIIDGRELLALHRHTQGVTAIDCTDDGNLVMTAARDGRILLWPAPAQ